jgi:hypothetical protein
MTSFNTNSTSLSILLGSNTKISNNFLFDSANGILTVKDSDFKSLLFAENKVDGKLIYQILRPELGGTFKDGSVALSYDTSDMNDGDDLLVVYEVNDEINDIGNNTNRLLVCIIEELKEVNKNLKKVISL